MTRVAKKAKMAKKAESAKFAKIAWKQSEANWRKNQNDYNFQKAETAKWPNGENCQNGPSNQNGVTVQIGQKGKSSQTGQNGLNGPNCQKKSQIGETSQTWPK